MTNIYKIIKNLKKTYNKYIKNNAVTVAYSAIVLFLICVIIWQSVTISKLKNENIKLINKINDIEKSDINEDDKKEIATSSTIEKNKEKKQQSTSGFYHMPFDAIARDGIFAHTLDMMYLAEANEKHSFNYNSIDRIGTSRYSCLDIISICGDSYSIQLYNYIASALNVSVPIYAYPGQSIVENEELYNKAIDSSSKVIVLSTSVNDVMDQTDPLVFKSTIERLYKRAYENNKILIVHSNVDFWWDSVRANDKPYVQYVPKYYDAIVKRSAEKYENVIYIDCNDIAVSENMIDKLHYNFNFNKILLDRIDVALFSKLK